MLEDKETLIKEIMVSNNLPEYVAIDASQLASDDRVASVPDEQTNVCKDVDLIKMAMYYVQGYTTADLAQMFGISRAHVLDIKQSEKFKQVITLLNAEIVSTARTFLTASGMKALVTLLKCLDSRDDKIKLKASTEILDRIGLKAPEQITLIHKGDRLQQMSDEELYAVVKMGMDELLPRGSGVEDGAEYKAATNRQG